MRLFSHSGSFVCQSCFGQRGAPNPGNHGNTSNHCHLASVSLFCAMRMFFLGLVVWIGLRFSVAAECKPNGIVILTDNQGSMNVCAYGAGDVEAPDSDRLAAEGTRFTRFHAAAPVTGEGTRGMARASGLALVGLFSWKPHF